MLDALGVEVVALRDELEENTPDIEILEKLQERDVVFVTADRHQLTRQHEAMALKQSNVTAIFFGPFWANMKFWQQAAWLVNRWERIEGFLDGVEAGTIAEIRQNGKALPYHL